MQLEEFIKNKLNTFEYSNKASDWNEFEKKLPKKKVSITRYLAIGVVAAILTAIISVYLTKENKQTEPINTQEQITKINKPTKPVDIKENTNTPENNIVEINNSDNNKNDIIEDNNTNNNEEQNIITENNLAEETEEPTQNEAIKPDETSNTEIADNYQPNSLFTVSNIKGCLPLSSNFAAKENHKNVSFNWEFSDGYKSNKKTVKHIFKKAGEYTVKLITKYKENNKTNISEQTITVYPAPNADFTYTQDEDVYYFDGPDDDKLSWNFGDNTTTKEIDPEHAFKLIGKTNIELTVKNEYGCTSTKKENINIEPIFKIANAFSPDNNGFNDAFGPIFEYPENYDFELYIYNAQGKLYFKSSSVNQTWNGKINNTEQLAEKGYYLWKLIIKDKYGNRIIKNGNLNIKY